MEQKNEEKKMYRFISQENGPVIGAGPRGVKTVDGKVFRNLSGDEALFPYEDWRIDAKKRAQDLASRLSIEQIAGLMLYSPHQTVPAGSFGPFIGTYNGKYFNEGGIEPDEITDQQQDFLLKNHIRHVLVASLSDAETVAKWNNRLQAFAEQEPFGIPISFSSDPRHGADESSAEYKSNTKVVSKWPQGLGMAATFSKELALAFGKAAAKEYRALGITTALWPQVDLATEPRWMRFEDTFGQDPELVTQMSKAYCDGMQTTENTKDGWGKDSVAAMAKHWPGGGTCEGGRDAHYPYGKYAVYPGKNLQAHLKPFTEGAFSLDGPTKCAASIMPYYTISYGLDEKDGKNVGNSYSHYLINDLLREKYGFEGVVCTDWGITADPLPTINSFSSRCYGVEDLNEAERHLLAIENGVDQFGGNAAIAPIVEAYRLGCERHGEKAMRERMERSAARLLTNMFRCGLFENPYLDPEESKKIVGCEEYVKAGYEAQLRSVVLLKNKDRVLPLEKKKKVYIPKRYIGPQYDFFRNKHEGHEKIEILPEQVKQWYEPVDDPSKADFALVFMESPLSDGYSADDCAAGGNGYVPISLQYRPYTATLARKQSLAGGDFREADPNRSYFGKTNTAANEGDLDLIIQLKQQMPDKPVIAAIRMHNPAVLKELEPYADAIVVDFGVQHRAILDIISGTASPSGRLPIKMPSSMETIEVHKEDLVMDYEAYTDTEGNTYDFGFGLKY